MVSTHPSDVPRQLRLAADILSAVSDTPRLDAELLLSHALGVKWNALLIYPNGFSVPESFAGMVARRLAHEPVAYITGWQDFWTIRLAVGPGVLIPRSDSETLLDVAVATFGADGPATILDLGTGPGTLLLAALDQWPGANGVGVDASAAALDYARDNAAALGLADRATFTHGGWADGGVADLVLCNPPYVERDAVLDPQVADHEPAAALFAGADGLDDYRVLIPLLSGHLAPGGLALLEIGWRQAEAVTALAQAAEFAVTLHRDLGGRDRVLALRRD